MFDCYNVLFLADILHWGGGGRGGGGAAHAVVRTAAVKPQNVFIHLGHCNGPVSNCAAKKEQSRGSGE